MYTIQTNASGTRSMEISEENLQTIEKYALFQHLIDSNGIVDESVLEKLKLNIRSLITSEEGNNKELLDLCIDVIYHNNMKAFGLHQLILLYIQWEKEKNKDEEEIINNLCVLCSKTKKTVFIIERIQTYRLVADNQERSRDARME